MKSFNCYYYWLLPMLLLLCAQSSCNKYLDEKRIQNLATPSSVKDLQAVIDNQTASQNNFLYPEYLSDNYYMDSELLDLLGTDFRLSYVWDKDAIVTQENWHTPYYAIYNANFVLDNLSTIKIKTAADQTAATQIKGIALFFRSCMFHQLAQLFCKPYSSSAGTDPGIVLRLSSAIEDKSTRSTVQETYNRIIDDLKLAAELLPDTVTASTIPAKAAAYALLARVYVTMNDFINAKQYAEKCLLIKNELLDYNTNSGNNLPGFAVNPEILFLSCVYSYVYDPPFCNIDSGLYNSYAEHDLRKTIYFAPSSATAYYWKGSYFPDNTKTTIFNGLALDEVYLIRAECNAREGNKEAALKDLNYLLRRRFKTGEFNDYTASTADAALKLVLDERRKELAFRGIRWSDLRRLNTAGANISLKRKVYSQVFTLPPNDPRWVLLIPQEEIQQSGIGQNPR